MTTYCSRHKLTLVLGLSLLVSGVIYAAVALELWVGTSDHIGLWNGPATLTARTLKTAVGETTGAWHYHPGYVYNVVRQGTITVEDGCGGTQAYSAGQALRRPRAVSIERITWAAWTLSSPICSSARRVDR